MKLLHVGVIGIFLMISYSVLATHTFVDERTGHVLAIKPATEEDLKWAQEFCIEFFKPIYKNITLDDDQLAHGSYEAFVENNFNNHYRNIFILNKYKFFVVEDCNNKKNIGYTIVSVDKDKIYSIETQALIENYSIQSLMSGLSNFINNEIEPKASCFISAVRKKMRPFIELLKTCDFEEIESSWLHSSMSTQYYQALIRKL